MEREQEKLALERKLARCRQLMHEYRNGLTHQHLREMEAKLLREISALEK